MEERKLSKFLVVISSGKEDSGNRATLGFACALSSLMMGNDTSVFLTGTGSVWGFKDGAADFQTQGFPPLEELIRNFVEEGGNILLCSTCIKTCAIGKMKKPEAKKLINGIELSGFSTVVDHAMEGGTISF